MIINVIRGFEGVIRGYEGVIRGYKGFSSTYPVPADWSSKGTEQRSTWRWISGHCHSGWVVTSSGGRTPPIVTSDRHTPLLLWTEGYILPENMKQAASMSLNITL